MNVSQARVAPLLVVALLMLSAWPMAPAGAAALSYDAEIQFSFSNSQGFATEIDRPHSDVAVIGGRVAITSDARDVEAEVLSRPLPVELDIFDSFQLTAEITLVDPGEGQYAVAAALTSAVATDPAAQQDTLLFLVDTTDAPVVRTIYRDGWGTERLNASTPIISVLGEYLTTTVSVTYEATTPTDAYLGSMTAGASSYAVGAANDYTADRTHTGIDAFRFQKIALASSHKGASGGAAMHVDIDNVKLEWTECARGAAILPDHPGPCQRIRLNDFSSADEMAGIEPAGAWHVGDDCYDAPSGQAWMGTLNEDLCRYLPPGSHQLRINMTKQHNLTYQALFSMNNLWGLEPDGAIQIRPFRYDEANPSRWWTWGDGQTHPDAGAWGMLAIEIPHFFTQGPSFIRLTHTGVDTWYNASGPWPIGWLIDDVALDVIADNLQPVAQILAPSMVHDLDFSGDEPVSFNASTSSDADGTLVEYRWALDGVRVAVTGPDVNLSPSAGHHIVTLTVRDDFGAYVSTDHAIEVNTPPVLPPDLDQTKRDKKSDGKEAFTFSASATFDPDGDSIAYEWTKDGVVIGSRSSLARWLTVGATATVETYVLSATDEHGARASMSVTATLIPNLRPVAVPTVCPGSEAACPANATSLVLDDWEGDGEFVRLDGTRSYDPDGNLTRWLWDGGRYGCESCKVRLDPGNYDLDHRVDDDDQAFNKSWVFVKINGRPFAVPAFGCRDTNCTFDATASTDPNDDALAYAWELGDNTTSTQARFTHDYAGDDVREVCLTVNDSAMDHRSCVDINPSYDEAFMDAALPNDWSLAGKWKVISEFDGESCPASLPTPTRPGYLANHFTPYCDSLRGGTSAASVDRYVPLTGGALRFVYRGEMTSGLQDDYTVYVEVAGVKTQVWARNRIVQPAEDWAEVILDLTPYSGQAITVHFEYDIDGTALQDVDGWLIDRVQFFNDDPPPFEIYYGD